MTFSLGFLLFGSHLLVYLVFLFLKFQISHIHTNYSNYLRLWKVLSSSEADSLYSWQAVISENISLVCSEAQLTQI